MTTTTLLIAAGVLLLLGGLAFFFIVICGGLAMIARRKPATVPSATFAGVRPAPPEDLIDAGTVQTLIHRYNEQRREAREQMVLDDLAATLTEVEE